MENPLSSIVDAARNFARSTVGSVREINKKYEKPRIQMTPFTKACLLALRLYLILLVIILFYKFYTIVVGTGAIK